MADLPREFQSTSSQSTKVLQNAVKAIHEQLEQAGWQGNQWLVIRGISQAAIKRLSDKGHGLAGISFRFMWVGITGLIKVVPSAAHHLTTSEVRGHIDHHCFQMGVPYGDITWGQTATTGTVTTHGKQADECINPRSRRPVGGEFNGWPTLVIETGVSESLAKLRRDATWWFQNSSGETRIVILISIQTSSKTVRFENWQLVPRTLPRPVTGQAIAQLRQQPNQMPPLFQQPANNQIAFSIQEIIVTLTTIIGGPLVIPFQAVVDRQPTGTEVDVIINNQSLRDITCFV